MKTFEELGLSDEVIGTLSNMKIKTPSEIQEKTIPLVLAGRDVIGGSATGSGKTLVFAAGIIENFEKNGRVQALVLTPTRELAEQVAESIKKFSRHKKLNVLPVYGGVSIETQVRLLRNTDVVVGTPGRILDHMRRDTLNLGQVRFLVLDEVDRMFDMGFQRDVEMILGECPKKRQTMLFSATISPDIDYLAQKYTKNPAEVSVKSYVDPSQLKQVYYDVPDQQKFSLFVHLLKKEKAKLVMVFCATRRNVDFVTNNLNNLGIKAKAIHGGLHQNKRNSVMNEFNGNGSMNVLVCTDVAARGLDIKGVSHVYNYDLPKTSGEYIHRIGRTARAGKDGIAISILCSRDYENFNGVQRDKKLEIKEEKLPSFERVNIIIEERSSRFGNRGGQSSRGRTQGFGRSSGDGAASHGMTSERGRPRRIPKGYKTPNYRMKGQSNNFSRPRSDSGFNRGRSSGSRDNNFSRGSGSRSSFGNRSPRSDRSFSRGSRSGGRVAQHTPNYGMKGQSNSFSRPQRGARSGGDSSRGARIPGRDKTFSRPRGQSSGSRANSRNQVSRGRNSNSGFKRR